MKPSINETTQTVRTIDQALELVAQDNRDLSSWKIKTLGLRQVLLGLAEVQSLRLSRLSTLVYLIEGEIMKRATLEGLDPRQLFALYRLTTETMKDASDYVQDVVRNVNWSEFESELLLMASSQTGVSANGDTMREAAKDLLAVMSRLMGGDNGNGTDFRALSE